jgi:epoxyqueuosine reductase
LERGVAAAGSVPIRGEAVVDLARECGLPLVGITPATPLDGSDERRLRDWLAAGKQGEMAWLADRVEERVDPRRAMPGARTMILVAEQYWRRNPSERFPADPDAAAFRSAGVGRVAKYARGEDYHKRFKKRLFEFADAMAERYRAELAAAVGGEAGGEGARDGGDSVSRSESGRAGTGRPTPGVKVFVDTAPIMERQHAARAGLGWVAKHSLVIHPRRGSYLFLGGVLTALDIAAPKNQRPVPDRCGTCTRCINACPTDAITPYSVDATKCISYLTIEHRSAIEPAFHREMGEWVFGCDICQDVCPHNSPRTGRAGMIAARPEYAPRGSAGDGGAGCDGGGDADGAGPGGDRAWRRLGGAGFDLLDMLGWDEADRRRAVERSAMKRASLSMFRRNAVIAAGNVVRHEGRDAATLRARLAEIAADASEEELVRTTAADVLAGLGGG